MISICCQQKAIISKLITSVSTPQSRDGQLHIFWLTNHIISLRKPYCSHIQTTWVVCKKNYNWTIHVPYACFCIDYRKLRVSLCHSIDCKYYLHNRDPQSKTFYYKNNMFCFFIKLLHVSIRSGHHQAYKNNCQDTQPPCLYTLYTHNDDQMASKHYSHIWTKIEFSQQIFEKKKKKKAQLSLVIKIRPVGAELFHRDRRTDTKLTDAFRNFANAPYKF